MKIAASFLMIMMACAAVAAQAIPSNPDLKGFTRSIVINGEPALQIATRDSGWIEVVREKRGGEDVLIIPVTGVKSYFGIQKGDDGKVIVSKTKVIFTADYDTKDSFELTRKDILETELKKVGPKIEAVYIRTATDKKRFVVGGTVFRNGQTYNDIKVLRPAISFLAQALRDFDSAIADFELLTAAAKK